MLLEVVHAYGAADEWCVTVDGKYVVGFAGPDARYRALKQLDELQQLMHTVASDRGSFRALSNPRQSPADQ